MYNMSIDNDFMLTEMRILCKIDILWKIKNNNIKEETDEETDYSNVAFVRNGFSGRVSQNPAAPAC